jgi:hypothetical protein
VVNLFLFSFSLLITLSPAEKLQLNDAIWDEASEILVEHQKIVLERKQKSKTDPSRMLDWEAALKKLKS